MIRRLHHVGIVTSDIEAAVRHYTSMFGCATPTIIGIDRPGLKFRTAMVSVAPGSGGHVQLIEPEIGFGVEELRSKGEGTIIELAFEVDDIEAFSRQMHEQGMPPLNLLGQPIDSPYLVASSGNRYLYLPRERNFGTSIEIIQVMPKQAGAA
jgi:catechol 2,3-dioxygenase-like lactoylglutathione lyase family enzyme